MGRLHIPTPMSHGNDPRAEPGRREGGFDPLGSGGWRTELDSGAGPGQASTAFDPRRLVTDGGTTADADEDPAGSENQGDGADTQGDGGTLACPACETEIAVSDNFCRSCGANVAGIDETGRLTSCPDCGTDVDPGDSFCRQCGEHLESYRPGASARGADRAGTTDSETAQVGDDAARGQAASEEAGGSGTRSEPDGAVGAESGADTTTAESEDPTAESETDTATAESPGDAADGRQGSEASTSGASEAETSTSQPTVPGSESAESEASDSGASDSEASVSEPEVPDAEASEAETDAAATGSGGEPAADEGPKLSLVARNREIEVGDGDTVGKEIRSIIMDTGGEEEDAVRVHREHVRFEREDGQFYLVDQGKNPTSVNGEELEAGDRVPVSPGDRIDLSGVAKIGIREA